MIAALTSLQLVPVVLIACMALAWVVFVVSLAAEFIAEKLTRRLTLAVIFTTVATSAVWLFLLTSPRTP